ncbi:hypothetical protein MKX03_014562 [Papaver bracteatum]|nr:hypothetical protein MKX03_014562 [Papaver bracteatum]
MPVLQYLLLDRDIQKPMKATISDVHLLEEVMRSFIVTRMHRVGSHSTPLTAPTRMHYVGSHSVPPTALCTSRHANVLPDESHAKKARQAQDMEPDGGNSDQQSRKFTLTRLL